MNYKKWILVIVAVAGLVAVTTAYFVYNKPHADIKSMDVDHRVDAAGIYSSFNEDEKTANDKYLNDVIVVEGELMSIETSEDGGTTFILDGGSMLGGVKCELDTHAKHSLESVSEGDKVTLKGICTGFLMDVIIVRCIIISKS